MPLALPCCTFVVWYTTRCNTIERLAVDPCFVNFQLVFPVDQLIHGEHAAVVHFVDRLGDLLGVIPNDLERLKTFLLFIEPHEVDGDVFFLKGSRFPECFGYVTVIKRSDILDEANSILLRGTLIIDVEVTASKPNATAIGVK